MYLIIGILSRNLLKQIDVIKVYIENMINTKRLKSTNVLNLIVVYLLSSVGMNIISEFVYCLVTTSYSYLVMLCSKLLR